MATPTSDTAFRDLADRIAGTILTPGDAAPGTDAVTRVLVGSSERGADPVGSWTTVGVHPNVVEASWLALVDALAFAALRNRTPVTTP